jgi:hypothetical protein
VKAKAVLPSDESERLKQSVRDWHGATAGIIAGLSLVATEIFNELSDCRSPLHDHIACPRDLEEVIDHLDDADAMLTNLLKREPLTTTSTIPNPTVLLRTTKLTG